MSFLIIVDFPHPLGPDITIDLDFRISEKKIIKQLLFYLI